MDINSISSARQLHEEFQLTQKKEAQKQKEVFNNLIKGAQLNSTLTANEIQKVLNKFQTENRYESEKLYKKNRNLQICLAFLTIMGCTFGSWLITIL